METENENLPAFYLSVGAEDPLITADSAMELYNSLKGKVEVELSIFAQNAHGYGPGTAGTNSMKWPELCDQFIQLSIRLRDDDTVEVCSNNTFGNIPEKYTKVQSFTGYAGFGTADLTVAVTDEEDAYFIYYEAYGVQVMLAGWLNDGEPKNLYASDTAFAQSPVFIMQGVDPDAWTSIER